MSALAQFLLDRIAEDEADARVLAATTRPPVSSNPIDSPARALAECEAKRRFVAAYEDLAKTCDHLPFVTLDGCCQCGVIAYGLITLAAVYSDHPDYDESWRV